MTGYTVAAYSTLAAFKTALEALSNNNEVHYTAYTEGARQVYVIIYRPKIVLESVPLKDVNGANVTCTVNSTNANLYDITLAEAGTAIFYPDYNGSLNAVIAKIGLICTGGGTMNVHFVYKPIDSWVEAGAISENDETDNYLVLNATQSARWTYLQPNTAYSGVPWGIAVTLSAAGTITMQVLKEA